MNEREFIDLLAKLGADFHFKVGQKVRIVFALQKDIDGEEGLITRFGTSKWGFIIVKLWNVEYAFYPKELRPISLEEV